MSSLSLSQKEQVIPTIQYIVPTKAGESIGSVLITKCSLLIDDFGKAFVRPFDNIMQYFLCVSFCTDEVTQVKLDVTKKDTSNAPEIEELRGLINKYDVAPWYGDERSSVYKVVNNSLQFSRNLRIPGYLVKHATKAKGTYVIFSNDDSISGLIVANEVKEVSPVLAHLPVSHFAPKEAWY